MRKLIAGMNMSLDGFCNHDKMNADEEIHDHYTRILMNSGTLIYGRTTYQLMESYWPEIVKHPTGTKATDDFAKAIDDIQKIVYSRTMDKVVWRNSTLKQELIKEDIMELKRQPGKPILVGSPGMIVAMTNLGVVDEFQICVQPIILGSGLTLFKDIKGRVDLKLVKTKTFGCGVVGFTYEVAPSR